MTDWTTVTAPTTSWAAASAPNTSYSTASSPSSAWIEPANAQDYVVDDYVEPLYVGNAGVWSSISAPTTVWT